MPGWLVFLATVILFPALAAAQAPPPATTDPPLLIPLEPPETFPPSGTQGGYLFNLRPLGADFGQALADHGFYIVARNLADEIATISGGLKQGLSFQGFTQLGFDLDMERIAGIPGGAIHFLLDDLQGQPFYAWTGSAYLNNRLFAGQGPAFRLNELSWDQYLFDKRVNLRFGRLPAYTQFDGSELYCTFITSLCRTPAAYTFDRGYPPYLASSWAAVAQIRIAGPFYGNIGVYENQPIAATTNHGGFPGPDWGLNYANGATFPVQFGYRTTLQNDPYPRAFSVGGFYATGTYADPLLNTAGQNRILAGGSAKQDYGLSQVWIQAQQMLYRPDSSDRGLTVFGGGNWVTSGEPNVQRMIFGGVYYKGPLTARPNDTAGLAISLLNVNPLVTDRLNSILSKTTHGQASNAEIDYEIYYGLAVAPGMTLKPFFGFMSHPDQANTTAPSGNLTHAVYIGAMFEVDFANMFGLPTLKR
jgi:porin